MDLFVFYPQYQVLVCKPCACAVPPLHLASHIKKQHAREACRDAGLDFSVSRSQRPATALARRLEEKYDILNPRTCKIPLPSPTEPPLPDLKLYRGYKCSRCTYILSKTKTAQETMEQHFNKHRLLPRKKGRPRRISEILEEDKGPMFTEVYCQRFFASCHQSSFFVVHVPSEVGDLKAKPHTCKADLLELFLRSNYMHF
ncbi:hypothetical protein PSPO01_16037 [Paraphaeosphaeria sporulosa]